MRYFIDNFFARLLLTAVVFFTAGLLSAQPLLIAGEGNADVTTAFSYDFFYPFLRVQ